MAQALTVPAGIDAQTAQILTQLAGTKFVMAAAGAAAGVKATVTVKDAAAVDTLKIDARLPGQHGNGYHLVITRHALAVGPGAARFDLLVYAADNVTLLESWKNLSMVDTHARYCETIINAGSDRIRVTDLDSVTADQRPANKTIGQANLTTGAGEYAVTGVSRGDSIVAAYNVTDAALVPLAEIEISDTDKCVTAVGGTSTAAKKLLLVVIPKAA